MTNNLQQLHDLSRPLRIMDLAFRCEEKLVHSDNIIADSVRIAMHNGTPYVLIVGMLKDMATDNRAAIENMVGVELTLKLMEI